MFSGTPGMFIADQQGLCVNLKDFCRIDGVSDDSVGFTNAYKLAASLGVSLFHPGGTLVKGNDTLVSTVPIIGVGVGQSIIKLKNGANTDLFSAYTSTINLSASIDPNGAAANTGANFWGIYNITLDGNKANQSSGTSYPIRAYGYGHVLEHIEIKNGYSGGILLDWHGNPNPTPPVDAFMPRWYDVMVHDCNGMLIEYGGPTDSQWVAVNGFAGTSHCVHIAPNAVALRMAHCHFWATPTGVSAVTLLGEATELVLTSCQLEGSDTCALVLLGSDCQATALEVGSTGDAARQGRGIQLGQQAGNTPYSGQVYQSGGLTSAAAANVGHFAGKSFECRVGTLDEQNTTGNYYALNAYQGGGTAIASNGGYPNGGSSGFLKVSGITPDGTPGKGGFFQIADSSYYGVQVLDSNTNSVIFSLDTYDHLFQLKNGYGFSGYSDNGSTLKYNLNASDGSLLLGNASSLRSGSGAPGAGLGSNGDYYFRSDTPGTANQRIYVKSGGSWVGIV